MKKYVKRFIPKPIGLLLRYIIRFEEDVANFLLTRTDGLIAPRELRSRVGPYRSARRYKAVGKGFFCFLKNSCALKPDENVLDIGCGCGQVAAQLTKYLNQGGTYEGFDIDSQLIEWCKRNISTKYPHFRFHLADVFNKMYNPKGRYKPSQYSFPYRNELFDMIFLKSVFTHMPQGVENYLAEVSRILKKSGRCAASYFLFNKASLEGIKAEKGKRCTLNFKHVFENYRTVDDIHPEEAVAYDEKYILGLYKKCGLKILEPIHYGFQDMIVARKE
jgi:SAM-dependent methyltransferase